MRPFRFIPAISVAVMSSVLLLMMSTGLQAHQGDDEPGHIAAAASASIPELPHDLSIRGMFMMADWVVQSVMVALVIAFGLVCTIGLAKLLEIVGANLRAGRALGVVHRADTLADAMSDLEGKGGPGAAMVRAAMQELLHSAASIGQAGVSGVKERVGSRLLRIEMQAGRRLGRGTGMLATIASTAPFVGLFGTVWGIMNAFIGISQAQTTNLAVVAPGIAEALLATALGLVAAIPAVVIYNQFARAIAGYRNRLADIAAGVERLVSRDLDFGRLPGADEAARMPVAAE